jgi:hypothetical protein
VTSGQCIPPPRRLSGCGSGSYSGSLTKQQQSFSGNMLQVSSRLALFSCRKPAGNLQDIALMAGVAGLYMLLLCSKLIHREVHLDLATPVTAVGNLVGATAIMSHSGAVLVQPELPQLHPAWPSAATCIVNMTRASTQCCCCDICSCLLLM